jgi:hypothetical protein
MVAVLACLFCFFFGYASVVLKRVLLCESLCFLALLLLLYSLEFLSKFSNSSKKKKKKVSCNIYICRM